MNYSQAPLRKRNPLVRQMRLIIPLILAISLAAPAVFASQLSEEAEAPDPAAEAVVRILYRGKTIHTTSSGETVAQLLARMELAVGELDALSPAPETETENGMTIRVDQTVCQRQTYAVTIPREVVRCNSDALPAGMEETLVSGADGELLRTADVTYRNGLEVSRDILREDVVRAPIAAIIAVGTGDPAEPAIPTDLPRIDSDTITLPTGEVFSYTHTAQIRATAYTHTDKGCNMITATGSTVHIGTVAVDPRYIPYGTRMFIMASDGSYIYGIAEAEDCGGDIIGDRMDLYLPTFEDCIAFGRRVCTVYFLG